MVNSADAVRQRDKLTVHSDVSFSRMPTGRQGIEPASFQVGVETQLTTVLPGRLWLILHLISDFPLTIATPLLTIVSFFNLPFGV